MLLALELDEGIAAGLDAAYLRDPSDPCRRQQRGLGCWGYAAIAPQLHQLLGDY